MDTATLKQKLHYYIDTAEDKKLEAIYTILENEIKEDGSWWSDKDFVTEMDRREEAVLNRTANVSTFEEAFKRIEKKIKTPVTAKWVWTF